MVLNVFLYLGLEGSCFELAIWGIQLLFLTVVGPTEGCTVSASITDQSGNKDRIKNFKVVEGL